MMEGKEMALKTYNEMSAEAKKRMEDIARLDRIPLVAGVAGVIINLLMLLSWFDVGWSKGYALYNGQPFEVHASLGAAMFGANGEYTKFIEGCGGGKACSLSKLAGDCLADTAVFDVTAQPKETSQATWCQLRDAGAYANGLLWFGFLLGFPATIATLMYAAKEVPKVAEWFAIVENSGLSLKYQKVRLISIACNRVRGSHWSRVRGGRLR